jgi:hypothetical protein
MSTSARAVPPEGVRNNNPLNLKANQPYEGMVSQINNFCVFSSPVWGYRAAFRNYITKFDRGVNTISKLITEWAPPSENDTNSYIQRVCSITGFGPNEVIALKTWSVCSSVAYAQTIVECGAFSPFFTRDQMAAGALRAGIVDAPLPVTSHIVQKIAGAGASVAAAGAAGQSTATVLLGSVTDHRLQITLCFIALAFGLVAAFVGPKVVK